MYFGDLREVGESFSTYNPGQVPRLLSIDKCVARRDSQHFSQYNTSCLITITRMICDYTLGLPTATVIIIDNIALYTHSTLNSSI